MAEDKNISFSVVPKFADKTLENILIEPSKSIGNTFSDIWYLTLGGAIGQAAQKRKMKYAKELERYKEEIEIEISKIPESDVVEADMQIVGYVLESSKYCADKQELRGLFAKLIASSMDLKKVEFVHPIFTDIISKMTEIDAIVFKAIATGNYNYDNEINNKSLLLSIVTLNQTGVINIPDLGKTKEETISDVLNDPMEVLTKLSENTYSGSRRLLDAVVQGLLRSRPEIAVKKCTLTRLGLILKDICIE